MKKAQSVETAILLANANELAFNIMRGVLGNEVADSFNGSPLSRTVIYGLTTAQIQGTLSAHLKGADNAQP